MKKRICVVGSSYIGAVYRAYQLLEAPPERYEIDFYGHSHGRFPEVEISNGHVRKARFKSREKSLNVREYDAFVFYADLPAPHDLAKVIRRCVKAHASGQLIKTLIDDVVRSTNTFQLSETVRKLNGRPVFVLSGNVVLTSTVEVDASTYDHVVSLLARALRPHRYIPFPGQLFRDGYLPVPEFYRNSIDLTGEKASANSTHDIHHMNEAGGMIVLNAIIDALDETLTNGPELSP